MFSSTAFAQTAAGGTSSPNPLESFAPLLVMLVVLYFFVMRPQRKQASEHANFIKNLKRGDRVLTSGGIFGEVQAVDDKFATLEIADDVRVRILKSQIAGYAKEGNA
jgi:preprotein translocase subunit YajC